VRLVKQWRELERDLPENWGDARLRLTVEKDQDAERAASLLGPINPGRRGNALRLYVARRGELELVASAEAEVQPAVSRPMLAASWDAALAALPPDWSDVYAEIELVSTDWLERTALLMAPANPARYGGKPAFRFRVARRSGYGASPEMVRRCFERIDDAGIRGELRILRALSDTEHVVTQGPVWYVEGRSV
jgi:hypothetical protein